MCIYVRQVTVKILKGLKFSGVTTEIVLVAPYKLWLCPKALVSVLCLIGVCVYCVLEKPIALNNTLSAGNCVQVYKMKIDFWSFSLCDRCRGGIFTQPNCL